MSKVLAILGSGHLGQQIAHFAISDNHFEKVVFFDDFNEEKQSNGFDIIGKSNGIEQKYNEKLFSHLIIAIGYNHLDKRQYYFDLFKDKIPFAKIIHSSSWVDATAIIKDGCIIYPQCCIDANVVIDANTVVNLSCTISHDTYIGKHCFLSPKLAIAGFVKVFDRCILGIGTTIIDNIFIQEDTQTGAATVVINNIEKTGLYVGSPHKLIR